MIGIASPLPTKPNIFYSAC